RVTRRERETATLRTGSSQCPFQPEREPLRNELCLEQGRADACGTRFVKGASNCVARKGSTHLQRRSPENCAGFKGGTKFRLTREAPARAGVHSVGAQRSGRSNRCDSERVSRRESPQVAHGSAEQASGALGRSAWRRLEIFGLSDRGCHTGDHRRYDRRG